MNFSDIYSVVGTKAGQKACISMYFYVCLGILHKAILKNKKALKPFKIKDYQGFLLGALQGIRTPDLLVRSQTLYPAELAAQMRLKRSFRPPKYNTTNRRKCQQIF